jgi:hypothetical protein
MRRTHVINGFGALLALVLLVAGFRGGDALAFELVHASGALTLANSKSDAAIFNGDRLRPGVPVHGTVTIGNTGAGAAALAVEATAESDAPGTGGGSLWQALELQISDGVNVIYAGRAADLGRRSLGTLAVAGAQTYTFTAWLPSGTADDSFQGARLSLGFTWSASGHSVEPTPTPTAPATSTTAPTPATTTTTTDPNATVSPGAVFTLPPAKTCVRRHTLTLRLHPPRGVKVKSVKVTVNQKKAKIKRTGGKLVLRKLPKGKLKVQVKAVLGGGRKITLKRTYKSCTAR